MWLFLNKVPSIVAEFTFEACAAAGEAHATTTKFGVCKTWEKMSELRAPGKGLNPTFDREHVLATELVNAKLTVVRSVITAALKTIEGTVSEVIWGVQDNLLVDASSNTPVCLQGIRLITSGLVHCMKLSFCLALLNVSAFFQVIFLIRSYISQRLGAAVA